MTEVLVALAISLTVFGLLFAGLLLKQLHRPYRIKSVCPECHQRREARLVREGDR